MVLPTAPRNEKINSQHIFHQQLKDKITKKKPTSEQSSKRRVTNQMVKYEDQTQQTNG